MASLIHGMFIPPETQVEKFRGWNRDYLMGFTEAEIDGVGEPPAWPEDALGAVLLSWSLETVGLTASESWRIAKDEHEFARLGDYVLLDVDHVRLVDGITFVARQLKWEVINLGAFIGATPENVRGIHSLHAQGLQAAAYFPDWARGMNGVTAPFIMLSGYKVLDIMGIPDAGIDSVGWDWTTLALGMVAGRELTLSASWVKFPSRCWACPVMVGR